MSYLKRLPLLLLLGVFFTNAHAQALLETIKNSQQNSLNVFEMQTAFDNWAEGKNLDQLHGWKPIQRKIWLETTRVNPDGQYPDYQTFKEALDAVAQQRAETAERSGGAWWPVGPFGPSEVKNGYGQPGVGRVNCVAFHPTDPNIIYIGAPDGGIWKSTNAGNTWIPLGDQLPVPGVSAILIHPQHPDTIFIATGDSEYSFGSSTPNYGGSQGFGRGMGVFMSTNGGQSWTATGLSTNPMIHDLSLLNALAMHRDSTNYMLASGPSGIWRTVNGGANWGKVLIEPVDVLEQDPQNPNIVFAASSNDFIDNSSHKPVIYRSKDFGANWTKMPVFNSMETTSRINIRVAPSDSSRVYALAAGGDSGLFGIFRSDDGGDNWEELIRGDSLNLLGWNSGDPSNDQGGQGWYDLTLCVDPQDADRVFVGGVNLWGSSNGGRTWSITTHWTNWAGPSAHADLHQLRANPLDNRFYLCSDGGIIRTDSIQIGDWQAIEQCINGGGGFSPNCYDFPTEWTDVSHGLQITHFYKIDVFNHDDQYILAGAQDNSHVFYNNGVWSTVFRGDGMDAAIDASNPNIIYGASQNGNIHVSYDGGDSYNWNISDPAKNDGAGGGWVTPFESDYSNPSKLFAGFNQLWEYDPANGWEKLSDFANTANAREVALTPSNPNAIAVLKTGTTAAARQFNLTKDRGQTWENISSNLPAFSFAYPWDICFGNNDNELYVCFVGYVNNQRVYRTLDGGQTWENITKGLPKIPVVSIAHHYGSANHSVYIGTDFGVYYTNDDMDEWVPYNMGLPVCRVSDIDLNYASNKIYIASYGRGMWANDLFPVDLLSTTTPSIYDVEMSVRPNPATAASRVLFDGLQAGQSYRLRILDVLGRVRYEQELRGLGEAEIPLPQGLLSGLYYLNLSDGNRTQTVSFMVVGQ